MRLIHRFLGGRFGGREARNIHGLASCQLRRRNRLYRGLLPDRPGHPYEHLSELSLRVTRLDPSFHRAALFAAGILAWFHGIERPDEAADLLNEGMHRSPEQPLYALYLAALAYKKQGDTDRMVALLESSFDLPETPSTMKAILANLRQSRGEHREALALWERIRDNDRDRSEHARAKIKIAELKNLLRSRARF